MVQIIEHNDYNAPIDDINIVELHPSNELVKGKKAFRVFGNIWIIPSRHVESQRPNQAINYFQRKS